MVKVKAKIKVNEKGRVQQVGGRLKSGHCMVEKKPSFNLTLSFLCTAPSMNIYARDCKLFMHKHSVMHIKFFGNLNCAEIVDNGLYNTPEKCVV